MRYLVFWAALAAAYAQSNVTLTPAPEKVFTVGTQPKASPAEYPAQARLGSVELAADYMVHSFGNGEQMYILDKFLIVEVALFPPKGESVRVESGMFSLRVNGKKQALLPVTPGMAASSLTQREWRTPRGMMGGVDVGGIGVGTGYPGGGGPSGPGGSTYPGGPQQRLPAPPRAPEPDYGDNARKPEERAEDVLVRTALPDGTFKGPVSGFLFFPYSGKASGVKTAELLYHDAVLKLK